MDYFSLNLPLFTIEKSIPYYTMYIEQKVSRQRYEGWLSSSWNNNVYTLHSIFYI